MTEQKSVDPIFESSLRELKWILLAWLVNFIWVIGYCSLFGYSNSDATVMGMPSWAFWGVFLPWIVMTLFTVWFAFFQMTDHPYEDEEHDKEHNPKEHGQQANNEKEQSSKPVMEQK